MSFLGRLFLYIVFLFIIGYLLYSTWENLKANKEELRQAERQERIVMDMIQRPKQIKSQSGVVTIDNYYGLLICTCPNDVWEVKK